MYYYFKWIFKKITVEWKIIKFWSIGKFRNRFFDHNPRNTSLSNTLISGKYYFPTGNMFRPILMPQISYASIQVPWHKKYSQNLHLSLGNIRKVIQLRQLNSSERSTRELCGKNFILFLYKNIITPCQKDGAWCNRKQRLYFASQVKIHGRK